MRLELGESLARYASTGFSLRGGRPAVGTVGGASMAGAVGRPLPAEASGPAAPRPSLRVWAPPPYALVLI